MNTNVPAFEEAEVIRPHGRALPAPLEKQARFLYFRREEVRLRLMIAEIDGEARGSIIFCPGRTEFIEKYMETAADFMRRGFNVLIVDPRGQGLSERLVKDGLKGYVKDFQDYADDLAAAVGACEAQLPKPHIVMGHSMGGLVALQTVISERLRPSAIICSAPMLGLFDIETSFLTWVFRIASKLGFSTRNLPFQKQRNGLPLPFENNKLTSDAARYSRWAAYFQTEPRLRVGPPTLGWIVAGLASMAYVNLNAADLKIPGLIVAAGADPIVDPQSNESFAERAGIDYQVVPGAKHELFLEQDKYRNRFWEFFDEFLEKNAL